MSAAPTQAQITNAAGCIAYKVRVRTKCFALYGSCCNHCGYADWRALQLDHVGGRPEKRKGEYGRGSTGLYIAILKGRKRKEDYQCLCANCNWIKRYNNPVESTRRADHAVVTPII